VKGVESREERRVLWMRPSSTLTWHYGITHNREEEVEGREDSMSKYI